ncbi:MAG: RagB/SusD family nutrient uptake outer membrane protein, partial [Paludibacter sp.]
AKGIGMDADILESLTDLSQSFRLDGGVYRIYYSGQYSSGTENGSTSTKYNFLAEDNWKGIRMAYIFIENIDRVPDADEATKKELKAEARMIIAMHYCDMYRHYGGLPWINHSIGVDESTQFPRLTSLATLDSITTLIDKTIPDLPWILQNLSNQDGRFTQASAMGLKARILLFGASPLFNNATSYLDGEASQQKMTWHGGYDANLWKKAADAAKALITKVESQGGYALVNTGNPRMDFRKGYYNRGNGEILISTRVTYQNVGDYQYLTNEIGTVHGIACPTQDYIDMFSMSNGLPITDPASGYDPNDPYKNRDPRLYESAVVNGDSYQGRPAQLWIGGVERNNISNWQAGSGYIQRKFILDRDVATSVGSIVQWPYLRLPEIYLSYAEASNEVNNGPDAESYRCVNIVRSRVGLQNLPAGLNQVQFREAVLNERACEFFCEEVRFFDLIRWKRSDDFMKKLHGMNILKNGNEFTYNKFELPARYWQTTWSPKWYLSAFPPSEVNKGYGLVQNPGW